MNKRSLLFLAYLCENLVMYISQALQYSCKYLPNFTTLCSICVHFAPQQGGVIAYPENDQSLFLPFLEPCQAWLFGSDLVVFAHRANRPIA